MKNGKTFWYRVTTVPKEGPALLKETVTDNFMLSL